MSLESVNTYDFSQRHLGPNPKELEVMLKKVSVKSLDDLTENVVPKNILFKGALDLEKPRTEQEVLSEIEGFANENIMNKSFIGMGYYGNYTPPVILRNILENPNWYNTYTPYQAEISQGRLEALFNFQTMVSDLCKMEISNASLLDEGTAAAEAMTLCLRVSKLKEKRPFLVSENCHPQTIEVIQTRAKALEIDVVVTDLQSYEGKAFAVLIQYPDTWGK